MNANLAIGGSARGPTSAASSPAARRRARSIWKKRSCACRKPSGAGDVLTRGASDGRDAERVACDHDPRGEPFQSKFARESGQAASEFPPCPHDARGCAYGQQDRDARALLSTVDDASC